jgi:glycosyltransferase involved in cell wall biosynthesis
VITPHGEIDDALTIIVPTVGRPSLEKTLDSIASQIRRFDQVFVVGDGIYPESRKLVQKYGVQYAYFELPDGPHHDWGARARNFGIEIAKKAYIAFMDDDDHYLPWAFEIIKEAVHRFPGHPFIFRMQHEEQTIWKTTELSVGNVSSQMIIVPNDQKKLGRFSDRYEGDFDFIKSTADFYSPEGNPFIWSEDVISVLLKANGKTT